MRPGIGRPPSIARHGLALVLAAAAGCSALPFKKKQPAEARIGFGTLTMLQVEGLSVGEVRVTKAERPGTFTT